MNRTPEAKAIQEALAAPFETRDIKWKPQMVKQNRCMALAYIDARLVCDRLDDVLGVEGWKDSYQLLPDGSVQCLLSLRLFGEWVTKEDVGSQSEQPDGGDRLKAAFSDALKRAAIKFGIGRYLYRLPHTWVDYDPVKKQIVNPPQLPAFAIPSVQKPASGSVKAAAPVKDTPTPAKAPAADLPKDGAELFDRLSRYDAKLAGQKLCRPGDLLAAVTDAGIRAGYGSDPRWWSGPSIPFAVEVVKEFEAGLKRGEVPATGRGQGN